jgi:dephospho-CoA kinase
MPNKIIIGIVGENASGKTTVTEYLKNKYGAVCFRFSDMLGDILARLYLAPTRANFQKLSTVLRQNFSEDIMSQIIAEDVKKSDAQFIITEGVRRPTDVSYLKDAPGFHLIAITADEATRFERVKSRHEKSDDANKTWEQFKHESTQESEQKIREIADQAEVKIDNNGSIELLYQQLDALVTKFRL